MAKEGAEPTHQRRPAAVSQAKGQRRNTYAFLPRPTDGQGAAAELLQSDLYQAIQTAAVTGSFTSSGRHAKVRPGVRGGAGAFGSIRRGADQPRWSFLPVAQHVGLLID